MSLSTQKNFRSNHKIGGTLCPDFTLDYKTGVIKTVWGWHKNRHIHELNRNTPEINICTYGQ